MTLSVTLETHTAFVAIHVHPGSGVVAVLNKDMDILNRTWCLYEMWCVCGVQLR